MPSLTVRSFAEMLNLPAHAQSRILAEQKYPKAAPQIFRTPYYQQALTGIRGYYKNGKSTADIDAARAKIDTMKSEARRVNNLRVLNAFGKSDIAQRNLSLIANQKLKHTVGTVELKVSPDLTATENGTTRYVYLHCRGEAVDPEVARLTIEMSHWALENAQVKVHIGQFEFVDLNGGKSYTVTKRRASTVKAATENIKIIETLWPAL